MESLRNGRGIWNVRAIPRWQTASGVRPPISAPSKRMLPAVGVSAPEMQLKAVVLPEPFGPMRPRISPFLTSKDTPLRAVNPPKRLVSPVTVSIGCEEARGGRQQHRRIDQARDHRRIDVLELALHDLKNGGERAHVLAGHRVPRRVELHAVALHRAALGNVRLPR